MADAKSYERRRAAEVLLRGARSRSEEDLARTQRQRDGAIMFGEKAVNISINMAMRVRDLRRAMQRAHRQLNVGLAAEARMTIEKALADDDR
jgi:hypothetical protein